MIAAHRPESARGTRRPVCGSWSLACDAFTLRFFDRAPETIGHIRIAHELGIGEIDLSRLEIREYPA